MRAPVWYHVAIEIIHTSTYSPLPSSVPERLLPISRFTTLGVLAVTILALVVVVGVSTLEGTAPLRTQVLDGGETVPDPDQPGETAVVPPLREEAWEELQYLTENRAGAALQERSDSALFLERVGNASEELTDFQTKLLDMYEAVRVFSQPAPKEAQPL